MTESAAPHPAWAENLLSCANAARAAAGCIPLVIGERQMDAAAMQISWITSPTARPGILGSGAMYLGWVERMAVAECPVGTVVAMTIVGGAASAQGVIDNIMKGSAYVADRAALLNPDLLVVGLGNGIDAEGNHYWVIMYQSAYKV